jgi:hypothetical protein
MKTFGHESPQITSPDAPSKSVCPVGEKQIIKRLGNNMQNTTKTSFHHPKKRDA